MDRGQGLTGDKSIDEWTTHWADHGTWCEPLWPSYCDNYARRHDPDVLVIIFEEMRERPCVGADQTHPAGDPWNNGWVMSLTASVVTLSQAGAHQRHRQIHRHAMRRDPRSQGRGVVQCRSTGKR